MSILSVNNITLEYQSKVAIRDINFSIADGDYLCIVGDNGSGKSTLLKGLLGLKKPSEGKIIYDASIDSHHIGYLPQQTIIQRNFPASVCEVVLSGCLNSLGKRPFYQHKHKIEAKEAMKKLNIYQLKTQCYRELSIGQQQRVLLARALCATKKLLVLDEPVAGLDPIVSSQLYDVISDINSSLDITIIMVTHDVKQATKHASHILHLDNTQRFFGQREAYIDYIKNNQ